jgi:hypothetical protein
MEPQRVSEPLAPPQRGEAPEVRTSRVARTRTKVRA